MIVNFSKPSVSHYLNDWHRTPSWQQLSWVGGDEWAELLCEAADASEDPPAVIRQLVAVSRLGGKDAATALYAQTLKKLCSRGAPLPLFSQIDGAMYDYISAIWPGAMLAALDVHAPGSG